MGWRAAVCRREWEWGWGLEYQRTVLQVLLNNVFKNPHLHVLRLLHISGVLGIYEPGPVVGLTVGRLEALCADVSTTSVKTEKQLANWPS